MTKLSTCVATFWEFSLKASTIFLLLGKSLLSRKAVTFWTKPRVFSVSCSNADFSAGAACLPFGFPTTPYNHRIKQIKLKKLSNLPELLQARQLQLQQISAF